MNYFEFLSHVTTIPGTSGYETPVAGVFARAFEPYCDEVTVDHNQSVIAVQRGNGKGPKIMLCAHIDEVGLMTMNVEEDGSVRFISLGVAAQTLPAQEVNILAEDGAIYGVIGAVPPHLTAAADRGAVTPVDELFIDTGLPYDEVVRRVKPGTPVQLVGRTTELANHHVASKTMDDRACVAILLDCAQQICKRAHDADVYYVLSACEERGSLGADMAAENIRPDMAFVLDVTHGTMPGCAEGETFPLDVTAVSYGPNTHRKLAGLLKEHAEKLHIKTQDDISSGNTWTDAWEIQVAAQGVPCVVMSLPLKYMHTTVEVGNMALMADQARLLCETVCAMDAGWEESLCF
ncbi:MAG: M42 family metallopeptidase [Clostridiales bacterium]|nr:M42 family metallopeptidase [Clostridiales bacterium]